MTKYKIMVLLVLASLIILSSKVVAEAPLHKFPQDYVREYADKFGADKTELLATGHCESGFRIGAQGDLKDGIYLAEGIYMYHDGTWNHFVSLYQREYLDEELDKYSYHDQAKLTAWIFANHPELKTRWSMYVAWKNGGTYSFYSNLLEKQFTIHCYYDNI